MIDQSTLFTVAGAAALIWAIIQTFVKAMPALPARWYPVLALIVGPILVPVLDMGLNGHPFSFAMVVLGLLAGLAAPGSHEVVSAFTNQAMKTLSAPSISTPTPILPPPLDAPATMHAMHDEPPPPPIRISRRKATGPVVDPTDSSGPAPTPS